jgi:hypothetical protein
MRISPPPDTGNPSLDAWLKKLVTTLQHPFTLVDKVVADTSYPLILYNPDTDSSSSVGITFNVGTFTSEAGKESMARVGLIKGHVGGVMQLQSTVYTLGVYVPTTRLIIDPDGVGLGPGLEHDTISGVLHIEGPGQSTASPTNAGSHDATIKVIDTNNVTNAGGMVVFGGKTDQYFAGIKGLLYDSNSNGQGHLIFLTRNAVADTALTERLRIDRGGNVGVATPSPTNGVFEVTGQVYCSADCSALTFTDRTPSYEGDALVELRKIKGKNGKIDHGSLPEFAKSKGVKKEFIDESNPDLGHKEVPVEGRDLGAMISMLTVAVNQLAERLDKIEKGSV